MEVNRITGGSSEFIDLIRSLQGRVSSLETRGTGSIFISDQIVTEDPVTGVETIFGALPDGRYGLQEWVNDTEPPNVPSTPTVAGDRAVFEITWDGMDAFGGTQPADYDRTVVQMSTTDPNSSPTWVEVNYFTAAGRVIVGGQPYGEPRYFRLISYDKNSNASLPSNHASATLVSFMDSPEMTEYISGVETAVSDANSAASSAQTAAGTAATAASNAQTAAANAEKIAQDAARNTPNLVQNGSFENDFVGWTKENTNGSIATTGAYDGTKSYTVGTTGGGILQAAIPVKAGQIFEMSAYYKTLAGYSGSGGIRIQTSTDGTTFANTVANTLTANVNWTLTTIEYTVPAGVTHIRPRIAFASGAAMTAWIDKVVLSDVTTVRALQKAASDATAAASAASTKADNAAAAAEAAATAAGNAQTAANGKNTVWNQPTKPAGTAHRVGDIWFDTDNENLIHTWDGTDFVARQDGAINRAFTDIGTAQTAANNAASAASSATSTANEALGTANTASGNATTALNNANSAVTAANGKNKITTSTDVAPTSYVGAVGDEWRQKSTVTPFEVIKITTWDGSAWVNQTLGNAIIENLSADKLNAGTISALRIGANTITSDKLLIGSVTNLVPDPIFSTTTVWTANRQATGGMDGGGSLLIPTGTTLRGFYFGDTTTTVTHRIPVVAGGKYRVAVHVQTSTAAAINTISLYGKVWKSSATTTTTATIPGVIRNDTATPAATGWTRISGVFEIPAGYDRLTLGFYAEAGYTGTARFSNPMVQQAATGELIVDGAITTLKMAANSITADSGIIASLDASKISVGELAGSFIKAGTLTADRLVVGQGDNLISEPRFVSGSALTNARIAGSTAGATWVSPDYIGWNKSTAAATTHTLKLGGQVSDVSKPVIPVIAGRRYLVSWSVDAAVITTTNTRATLRWTSRTNVTTTASGTFTALTAVGFTSYTQEFVAPADAAFVSLDIEFSRHPGGGRLNVADPVLQLMTDGTIITKDTITSDHIQVNSIKGDRLDVSTAQARLFTGNVFQAVGGTFTGGTFSQGTHNEATFQTTSTAARGVKLTPTGLTAYDATTGNPTVQVNADGSATFTGTVNILAGNVPESTVPGLTDTLNDHAASADTVWSWTDPANRTMIHGGNISTNTIAAEKINLGNTANFVDGGYGHPTTPWVEFIHQDGPLQSSPAGVTGFYSLYENANGLSSYFNVSGLSKFQFTYHYVPRQAGLYHTTTIFFYNINNTFISAIRFPAVTNAPNFGWTAEHLNQVVPAGAVTARLGVVANQSGTVGTKTANWIDFSGFKMATGQTTMLTAAGMTSYIDGVQTLRLNGDDNLLIGQVLTGRPSIEPYIQLASQSNLAALRFYGDPGGAANRAAVWYDVGKPEDGLDWGVLNMYAINDNPTTTPYMPAYASGIKMWANGQMSFVGKLDSKSQMFRTGTYSFSGEFAGGATAEYTVTYPTPYPDNLLPKVFLTMISSAGASVFAMVTTRRKEGFDFRVRNHSGFGSGTTRCVWFAVRDNETL